MTTQTREQVVHWTVFSGGSFYSETIIYNVKDCDDFVTRFSTLARADLEAIIAGQDQLISEQNKLAKERQEWALHTTDAIRGLNATIAEQKARIQRRMDDIKLQAERYVSLEDKCRELRQQLAESQAEIEEIKGSMAYRNSLVGRLENENALLHQAIDAKSVLNLDAEKAELRQQLAESQAREQGLRDANRYGEMYAPSGSRAQEIISKALSQPTDSTALREWGAKLVEKVAEYWGHSAPSMSLNVIADKIRKGEF